MPKQQNRAPAVDSQIIELLKVKISRDPKDILAYYELALACQLAGDYRQMAKTLSSLVSRLPGLSLAHFLLSLAYAQLGKTKLAQAAGRTALRLVQESLQPAGPEADRVRQPAANLSELKEIYGHDPNYAEMKFYQKAAESDQFNVEKNFLLGLAYKRLGWHYAAIETFKQVTKMKPDYDEAFFELGNTYKQLEKLKEAQKAYQQAIQIDPKAAEAHFQLGLVLLKLQNSKAARQEQEILLKLEPSLAEQLQTEIQKNPITGKA